LTFFTSSRFGGGNSDRRFFLKHVNRHLKEINVVVTSACYNDRFYFGCNAAGRMRDREMGAGASLLSPTEKTDHALCDVVHIKKNTGYQPLFR
jgi:L-asparaginase/Glu-tRNA(Gln) amidotransferase subunit D